MPDDFDFGLPSLPGEKSSGDVFNLPDTPKQQKTAPFSSSRPAASSLSAVKELQQAILDFGKIAAGTHATTMFSGQEKRDLGNGGEYLGGSDPFGNFLGQHIEEAPGAAGQYLNTDTGNGQRAGSGIEDTNLRGIINDIQRIGTPGNETTPDGIWKQRTNHALLQIKKLMQTIGDLSSEMQLPIKGAETVIADFDKLVPNSYLDVADGDKAKVASSLADLIKQLSNIFLDFKSKVIENKDLRAYIDQRKPFATYQPAKQNGIDLLSKEERAVYQGAASQPVSGLQLANHPVSLLDLSNKQNFDQLMQRSGLDPKNQQQVQVLLADLMKQLGGKTAPINAPEEPAAEPSSTEVNVEPDRLGY